LKKLFVGPLQKAKPEKLLLTRMLSGVLRGVFQKARAAFSDQCGKRVRHRSVGLDAKPEPVRKCPPFKELRDRFVEAGTRNQPGFVLC
jgi:hypothetical protein